MRYVKKEKYRDIKFLKRVTALKNKRILDLRNRKK